MWMLKMMINLSGQYHTRKKWALGLPNKLYALELMMICLTLRLASKLTTDRRRRIQYNIPMPILYYILYIHFTLYYIIYIYNL